MPINSRQKGADRSLEERIKVISIIVRKGDQGLHELRTRKSQILSELSLIDTKIKYGYWGHDNLKKKLETLKAIKQ
tara:strand:- start:311 stop:538 length:228 start_codon:yes stop_codon:yes gene_type:complete